MAFGKRTDDVIGSTPNNPKLTKYIVSKRNDDESSEFDENKYFNRLNNKIDDLFDDFEYDEDIHFLSFKENGFIPIQENFDKINEIFLNPIKKIPIIISNEHSNESIYCPLDNSTLLNTINNFNSIDLYLTIGFLEFNEFKSPLFFVPITIDNFSVSRDFNRDVKFNYFLEMELKFNHDIKLPNFNINIPDYVNKLKTYEFFKITEKMYIGNFNFRKPLIFKDLSLSEWDDEFSKLRSFFNNNYIFSINDFKYLNDNIAKNWPNLDLTYNKDFRMKGADRIITNLLSQGNSILYLSSYVSKAEVKKSLKNNKLKPLILDFSYDLDKYSIFEDINHNLPYVGDMSNLSSLVKQKDYNENMLSILQKNYSNLELIPYEIQQNVEKFSNNAFNVSMENIQEISLDDLEDFNKDIERIFEDSNITKIILENSDEIHFSYEEYHDFHETYNSLKTKLNDFHKLNDKLNEDYGIIKFDNLDAPQYLENFNSLNEYHKYISKEDYNKLNQFILLQNQYDNLKNEKTNLFSQKLKNYVNNIINYKYQLIKFNDKVDEIFSLVDYYDISESELEEYIEYLELLVQHPSIIENENRLKYVIGIIEEHQQKKNFNGTLNNKLKTFLKENDDILTFLKEYDHYISANSDNLSLNDDVNELSNLFSEFGFNFKTLNEYLSYKDKLYSFKDAVYIENKNYFKLKEYLNEYINTYDVSLKSYLNNIENRLKVTLDEINDNIANRYSASYKQDLFDNINEIISIQKSYGFNFSNFRELIENEEFIKYLNYNNDLNANFSSKSLVNDFEQLTRVNTESNLKNFIQVKINEYSNFVDSVNKIAENKLKNNYNIHYIKSNLLNLIEFKDKLGVNFSTLNDFLNNLDIFDILINKPEFNYNLEDYALYSYINEICQENEISDIDKLLKKLNKTKAETQNYISNEIKPVIDSQYDLRFIRDKINEIEGIIDNISDLVNCKKPDNFTEIDEYIDNLFILKNKLTYIEDYGKFDFYIETLKYLKDNPPIEDDSYLNECNLKLAKLHDLKISDQLDELMEIIDICYKNNTSIDILNLKKELINLEENIENLNIDFAITDLDLDKCIEDIKPQFKLVSTKKHRNSNSKFAIIPEKSSKYLHSEINTLNKENSENINLKLKNYELNSRNASINKGNNYSTLISQNDEIYKYLKNKNVSKDEVIEDLNNLKEYVDEFNKIKEEISHYIDTNLVSINDYYAKKEVYDNEIEDILTICCPNSFKGIRSNIEDLNAEIQNNIQFSNLVNSGFFKKHSNENFSFDEISNKITKLQNSKKELIDLSKNSDFNLDDTFSNILEYINNLLKEIEHFNENSIEEIFELNYLNKYISDELLLEFNNVINNINILSNLDDTFINDYFKNDRGLEIKENMKLADEFNNLIKNNIFTDNTINYLENTSKIDIGEDIYKLKIIINSLKMDLMDNDFDLNNQFEVILNKIDEIIKENKKLREEIEENSYILNFINFKNYSDYIDMFLDFISNTAKFDSTINIEYFTQIINDLNTIDKIYDNGYYGENIFNFTSDQIAKESLKLKNNLIFSELYKKGYVNYNLPKDTTSLIKLINQTKELINKKDYEVSFEELIEVNEDELSIFTRFNQKYDEISQQISNNNLNYDDVIYKIENLSKEFSVVLDDGFVNLKNEISKLIKLINLTSKLNLDKDIYDLSKNDLMDYIGMMDLNIEFTDLINSKVFSKDIINFYSNDYESKLEKVNNYASNIIDFIDKSDLDKNLIEFTDSDLNNAVNIYSEINELIKKDLNETKDLIENNLLILDKLTQLNDYNLIRTEGIIDLSQEKVKLNELNQLYELELKIKDNEILINRHFADILKSNEFTVDKLYDKYDLDMRFTQFYNEGIFSQKTIDHIKYLKNIDISLDKFVPELYQFNNYLEIYENNKLIIGQLKNFEEGSIGESEFIKNTNEIFGDEEINNILNYDVNSQIFEYESKLSSLEDIKNKYFESNDYLTELKYHIEYTELIDNKLFDDEDVIKSNFIIFSKDLNKLNELYNSILNNIYKIASFYEEYSFFKLNKYSFNHKLTFDTLLTYLDIFNQDLDDLNYIMNIDSIIKSFIFNIDAENMSRYQICDLFNYNVYNNILNNFYEEFPEFKGENLNPDYYNKNLKKADDKININNMDNILSRIYSNFNQQFINDSEIQKQKEEFNKLMSNHSLSTIRETLNEFKEYFLATKPIFMMDINQFYEYISNKFESSFDYIVIDKNFDFEELDLLSLFFRSKNKLIDLR